MEETEKRKSRNDDFRMEDFAKICLKNWKWIVFSLIVCLGIGVLLVIIKQPVYERQEQILIKDQESGGGIGDLPGSFSALGLFSSNTSVYNELIAITSPAVMYEVVERLHIDVSYDLKKLPHRVTLYGRNQPYVITFPDLTSEEGVSLRMDIRGDGSARLYRFEKTFEGERQKFDGEVEMPHIPGEINTPIGKVVVGDYEGYSRMLPYDDYTMVVKKKAMQDAVEFFMKKLTGELADDYADVIDLTIKDVSVERGVDILNTVLSVYNDNWITDKNRMAVATSDFINERLEVIQRELGDVDRNLASIQSSTGTSSLEASAEISLKKESVSEDKIVSLLNRISILKDLHSYVVDPKNRFSIIPMNLGVVDDENGKDSEKQIADYNELLLERENLIDNSSASNPLVKDYDHQLDVRREAIAVTLSNALRFSEMSLASAQKERNKATGRMTSTPAKALPLLSEERQQKVKEALYLFLLEKREENELSMKFTADNTRVLTPPMGSLEPVAPKTKLILCLAFIFGLAIPILILYVRETGNTKVRSKKDLAGVGVPFAGEIPYVGKKNKFRLPRMQRSGGKRADDVLLRVVESGNRDVANEAFRVIRSNIDFMLEKSDGGKVVMLTSFNPASGKSVISFNLGLSFALKKKRVLLIDCDLRRGTTSGYVGSPRTGLTDYLTGQTADWRSLVKPVEDSDGLFDVLPMGKMPPNPTELLEDGRIGAILDDARQSYDIVILDCPPVNIVADTQVMGKYADMTLFVARSGLLEKNDLKELDDFYKEKKFRNMCVILNGTEKTHSRYYTDYYHE